MSTLQKPLFFAGVVVSHKIIMMTKEHDEGLFQVVQYVVLQEGPLNAEPRKRQQ
jgi:hypothetical protein